MRREAVPKLVLRSWAGLMGLASVAAISLVGVLSFGFYGAARLAGTVHPFRGAYQFLSRAYYRFLDRLPPVVPRGPRSTPAPWRRTGPTPTSRPNFTRPPPDTSTSFLGV